MAPTKLISYVLDRRAMPPPDQRRSIRQAAGLTPPPAAHAPAALGLRAAQQVEAEGGGHQGHAVGREVRINGSGGPEFEVVGKAGAAAAIDRQPQYRVDALLMGDERHAPGGRAGEGNWVGHN